MPQDSRKEIRLEDYFWTIWRSKFSIFIVFIVAIITAFVKNDISPPVYEAKTKIWIKGEQGQMSLFEDFLIGSSLGRTTRIETFREIITSRHIVNQTVEELELDKNPLPKHRGKIVSVLANLFGIELKDQVYDKYTEDILLYQEKLRTYQVDMSLLKEKNQKGYDIEKCLSEIKRLDGEIVKVKEKLDTALDRNNGDLDDSVLLQIKRTSRNLALQTSELLSYQNQIGLQIYKSESPDIDKYSKKIKRTEKLISTLTSNLESQIKSLDRQRESLNSISRYVQEMVTSARSLLENRKQFVQFQKQEPQLALGVLEAFTVIAESERLRRKKCIENFRENLEVKPLRETNIIEISVKSRDADRAQEIANTIAKNFKNYMREDMRAQMQATTDFAGSKADEIKAKLEAAENELARYQHENNMVDLKTEAEVIITTLEKFKAELTNVRGQKAGAEEKYKRLLQQLNSIEEKVVSSETLTNNPELTKLRINWINDKVKLAELKNKYPTGEHAEISRLEAKIREEREEIDKLEKKIISSRTTTLNPIHQQLSTSIIQTLAQVDAADAQEKVLQNKISEYNEILKSMPEKQVELAKRKREVALYQNLLTSLQKTNQEASIFKEAEIGNVKELDKAYEPDEPISPRRNLNLLLGALIGMSLGVGLAFLRDAIDNRYHTIEEAQRDFERLSPSPAYLGLIPPIVVDSNQDSDTSVPLISNMSRRGDNVLEAFRLIRTKLQFLKTGSDIKTMIVTSSVPGEGKTTIGVNSAITLGRMEKKVLLIDADLRRPRLHRVFDKISRLSDESSSEDDKLLVEYESDSEKKPGLSELLLEIERGSDIEELVKRVTRCIEDQENVYLIPSGTEPPEPSHLLSSDSMKKLMDYLKEQYDYIVVDAPPAGFADPMVLSEKVDCVLYVLDLSKAKKPEVQNGLENLIEITSGFSTSIGVVCNWAEISAIGYYYGYYYGYYRYKYGYYGSYYYDYDKEKKGIGRIKRFLLGNKRKRIGSEDDEEDTEN